MTTRGTPSIASKHNLVVVITFVAGLSVGTLGAFVILSIVPQQEHSPQEVARGEVEKTSTGTDNRLPSASTIGVGQFEEIFKHRSITNQHTALYAKLSGATEHELKEWWIQSKEIERASHREIAQKVILRNLTVINPQHALRYVDEVSIFQRDALLTTVFSEWALSNLDGAIKAAGTLEGSRRDVALQTILHSRDDLSEGERRSIALQLNDEEMFLRLVSDTKVAQSISEPKKAWNTLLNDDVDDSEQKQSLALVAQAWLTQTGFDVLSAIYSEIEDSRIRSNLVSLIAKVDPISALDYTRGLVDSTEQSFLAATIVREWARTDALAALTAVSTYEPSAVATNLEYSITTTWARSNPYELIENIEAISIEVRLTPLEIAFWSIARRDPLEALAKLSSIENYVGNTSTILNGIVREWAVQQPDAAVNWVLENFSPEDPQRSALLQDALQNMAIQSPNKAFELALDQPAPSQGSGLEFYVIRRIIRQGDVEVAVKLLPRVRENSQLETYSLIAGEFVDAGNADEALALGEDLEAGKRKYFYRTVVQNWTWHDAKGLYESLEELPTKELKSYAADRLIRMNQSQPLLTDVQIEELKTLLISEDEARRTPFE
ncbi:MAG: hypothetical protein OXH31_00830 [Gammaproteobacteria bacterium]|nr:hypothetical protein [Gammaproteobacteria bacterium]